MGQRLDQIYGLGWFFGKGVGVKGGNLGPQRCHPWNKVGSGFSVLWVLVVDEPWSLSSCKWQVLLTKTSQEMMCSWHLESQTHVNGFTRKSFVGFFWPKTSYWCSQETTEYKLSAPVPPEHCARPRWLMLPRCRPWREWPRFQGWGRASQCLSLLRRPEASP